MHTFIWVKKNFRAIFSTLVDSEAQTPQSYALANVASRISLKYTGHPRMHFPSSMYGLFHRMRFLLAIDLFIRLRNLFFLE